MYFNLVIFTKDCFTGETVNCSMLDLLTIEQVEFFTDTLKVMSEKDRTSYKTIDVIPVFTT